MLEEGAYFERPIDLRNPIVFYEGHLPAFSVNTLVKLALGEDGIDPQLEVLFARGIDPDSVDAAKSPVDAWPGREVVQAYGTAADELIIRAIREAPIDDGLNPQRSNANALFTILEHEQMHQETLLYMFHQLPYELKRRVKTIGRSQALSKTAERIDGGMIAIPPGVATLGLEANLFGWDNEFPLHQVEVPGFSIGRYNVTNGEFLDYMRATGAPSPHFWAKDEQGWKRRGMFALEPLPLSCPVYVTHEEAVAFASWRGMRLPTEAEYHRAAFGTPDGAENSFPWGDAPPDASRGNFDFSHWDPVPVGSYPSGVSAFGVHDMIGNGWEWTSTLFGPFDGFEPGASYPEYSADFFDDRHFVMKGASPVTARELIRSSFRNWFRPNYPYVYASFRCVL